MEPSPQPLPPKKPLLWPIVINLMALIAINIALGGGAGTVASAILGLTVVNLLAALLVSRFNRLNWVVAFLLSALLLPLIGFGLCALVIQLNGGLHGGH
ncbi:hypothetical protein [Hymenobacter glaciei]